MKNLRSSYGSLRLWPLKGQCLGLLLILALPLFGLAQDLDSRPLGHLRQIWYSEDKKVTYTQRMEVGLKLVEWYLTSIQQDSLLNIAQEMLAAGKQKKDPKWTAEGLYWIAKYHMKQGDIERSIQINQEALKLPGLDDCGDTYWYHKSLGMAYISLDQLDSAEYYIKKALASAQKHGVKTQALDLLHENLAYTYQFQGKYLDAIELYSKILNSARSDVQFYTNIEMGRIFKTLGLHTEAKANYQQADFIASKTKQIPIRLSNCSAQLKVCRNLAEAEQLIQKGLALRDSFESNRYVLTLFLSAGSLYMDSLKLDQATDFYQRALALAIKIKHIVRKNDALLALAKIHQLQGRNQASMQICQSIKAPLEKNQSPRHLTALYEILSKNYEALQQPAQALFYLRQKEAQEAILNDEENIKTALNTYIRRKSEGERRALNLAKNNAEKLAVSIRAKAQLNYGIFGLISLVLLGTVGAYSYFYRQKKSTAERLSVLNQSLELEKLKLTQANSKLRRFSEIVSNDILSNLDLILSTGNLLVGARPNLQSLNQYYTMSQKMSRQLKDYCLGLLAVAKTNPDPTLTEMADPNAVLSKVLERFGPVLQAQGFLVDKGELLASGLPFSVAEHVLQNLISNALLYSSQSSNPLLKIGSGIDPDGKLCWYVADNGPGHAEMINRAIEGQLLQSQKGQGMGLYLLQNTLQDYGWGLKAEAIEGGGVRMLVQKNN
jgi:tetratricopeptide (TPR) repeat protein